MVISSSERPGMQSDWLLAFKTGRLAKSRPFNVESAHKHSIEASEDARGCRKRWGTCKYQ